MITMQIDTAGQALRKVERPGPRPRAGELPVEEVAACGVCRTDLHVADGEVAARYPIIPGHEIVGHVIEIGDDVQGFEMGQRVGIPWLGRTCGTCSFCHSNRENLCDHPEFTAQRAMAAMRPMLLPMRISVSRCPRASPTSTRPRTCVPA